MADGVSPTQVQPLLRALSQTQQQEGESRPGAFLPTAMPVLPVLAGMGSAVGTQWAGVCLRGRRGFSPSPPQEPGLFEADVVSSQLRYSGILETIRIRKEGFPIRIPFLVFIDRCLGAAGRVPPSWRGETTELVGVLGGSVWPGVPPRRKLGAPRFGAQHREKLLSQAWCSSPQEGSMPVSRWGPVR